MRGRTSDSKKRRNRGFPSSVPTLAVFVLLALAALGAAVAGAVTPTSSGAASCLGKEATIVGSGGADVLTGTAAADVIVARGGADQVSAGGGGDLICAGGGGDVVRAGRGEDLVLGQAGEDRLFGGADGDSLVGGPSRDFCRGGTGLNTVASCETGDARPGPVELPQPASPAPGGIRLVDPPDAPPTAVDDEASFGEGEAERAIEVGANDTNLDGGPLSIVSITQPDNGTASIAPGGLELLYQPDPDYCNDEEEPDHFTYTLNGGSSASVSVSVACLTRIASTPALTPPFDPAISDYTVACDGTPLTVSGRTAAGTTVAVDGGSAEVGGFEAEVPLQPEQAFAFSVDAGGQESEHHVRCLPSDFPAWEYERLATPSHGFYVVTPTFAFTPGVAKPYVVIFDDHGVPLWWHSDSPAPPNDAKLLIDEEDDTVRVVWWGAPVGGDAYEIRDLEGNLLEAVRTTTGRIDTHEFQVTPSGNYLITSYQPREHVALTAFGGAADATVTDAVIEEVSPAGDLLWIWNSKDHIGLEETGRWWPTALKAAEGADIVHMNAVEPVGEDAVMISNRHNDAVYKVDKDSGEIVWKLGGTWTPKSLTVKNDPQGAYPLGGQHDVRLQPDGTITIHDNRTNLPGPPRSVRYEIDEVAKTATLVEEVTDPLAPSSICCGSSRRSPDGSWLFSWGGRSLVTEFDAAGQRTFKLEFGGAFSYRAVPAPERGTLPVDSALTVEALRAGMDSMHPRP
jgi:hypothetical protein